MNTQTDATSGRARFTDLFIDRPVLACVVSLVILLLGIRAGVDLKVRQYPYLQNAQLEVIVGFPGADPELIEGFVTTPLEREIAKADGIDYLTSATQQGSAKIIANLRLDKDPAEALTEIASLVNKLRNQLPEGSEDPIIQIAESGSTASMYMSFGSDVLSKSQVTDYLNRVVEPQLATIPGIQKAEIQGARTYAMRIWLNPERMAALDLTASDISERIRSQSAMTAVGETSGNYVKIGMTAETDPRTVEEFRNLVLKSNGPSVVRLKDVAKVELGAENYEGGASWNGIPAVFVAIIVRPEANLLEVSDQVHAVWPSIIEQLPTGLNATLAYDATVPVKESIREVMFTLVEAVLIVVVVVFLFLGSARNSLIPAVTVPLSLVGALFLMLILGFSINLLTLLAMVLAIGMVVDDAIIVMENIHRHIEEGLSPMQASLVGARELVGPVIAMTITLVAVYAPVGFLTGITGTLFSEFAFTLAGAVLISGVVALTLTPMMCSRILKPTHGKGVEENRLATWLDEKFENWRIAFKKRLHGALDRGPVLLVFGAIMFVSCYFLFQSPARELAPAEDIGFAFAITEADGFASQNYQNQYMEEMQRLTLEHPLVDRIFSFAVTTSQAFLGMIVKPIDERDKSTPQVLADLQETLKAVPGMRWIGVNPPALPTPGTGYPIEFVVKSTQDPITVSRVADQIIERAWDSKKFFHVASRLSVDRPEAVFSVDRDKAALMGVDMSRLSADLTAMLAGGEVARFAYKNQTYKVIQQVDRAYRLNPDQLTGFYTRSRDGERVPVSSLVSMRERVMPRSIEHAQQMKASTIIAVPRTGVSTEEALGIFESLFDELAPDGYQKDYSGPSRQFKQEGVALQTTFLFALIVIYLVLAAQFESFRDPIIILVTVPMAICGALLFLNIFGLTNQMQLTNLPGMSLNIYTQVGLITLIGVISKHGILIVDFANQLQRRGLGRREAVEEATSIRFRPVLMTTAALVVAMVPLLIAEGPGASARFSMGLVIAAGMAIGTLFTLYVVPVMYMYFAHDLSHQAVTNSDGPDAPSPATSTS